MTAHLGKFNLSLPNESESHTSSVYKIIIHNDWISSAESYDADIAVIVLGETIEFNEYIRPVCLPKQTEEYVTGDGIIVGWGKSERSGIAFDSHENTPIQVVIPAVRASYCYPTFKLLAGISSPRMFCGGYENRQKGPCTGDSGGGYYSQKTPNSPFIVQGIISSAITDNIGNCDINKFTLYTNVGWFADWVKDITRKNNQITWTDVVLECFEYQ